LLDTPPGWTGGLNLLLNLVYASALILFAFGVRPPESVTARRPLGTAAIVLLACWSLGTVVAQLAGVDGPATAAEFSFGWVDVLVRFVLAVIAGTQIARIRVVPAPWHWAPLLAIAVVAATGVLATVVAPVSQEAAEIAAFIDSLARNGARVLLGTAAIVLGAAGRSSAARTVSEESPEPSAD
jgi:hypothetical protein